jgi:gluconate 2-dehydrogenase subunit 3-like protein
LTTAANREPDRGPLVEPEQLPRQRRGVTPQMVGRYPDFDVLAENIVATWDDATRNVVFERLKAGDRKLEFFSREEEPTVRAFTDCLLAQHGEPRVPVVEMLDLKYAEGRLDGYQYEDLPDPRDMWHQVLAGLDYTARTRYGAEGFPALDRDAQYAVVEEFHQGVLQGGPWDGLNVKRAFKVAMHSAIGEFYSHPWVWNEIGFGGPAYPRGFARFGPLGPVEEFEERDTIGTDPVRDTEQRDRR